MNNKAIGVFDSGVGGLTVVWALMQRMPWEDIVYFGDTARVPYGAKSPESILRFAEENSHFLLSKNVKAIVVACNTATAIALPHLQEMFSVPVLGVVNPGAEAALETSREGRIGVIGTLRTISSRAYSAAIQGIDSKATVYEVPCPLFVPLIEENWIDHEATRMIIREYLDPLVSNGIDTLVLGCTHYPLLSGAIQRCYPELRLVDSASSTAEKVEQVFAGRGWAADQKRGSQGRIQVFLSDYTDSFRYLGERILKRTLEKELFTVNLEELGSLV